MSCDEMDRLLARYASGELTDDEEFILQVHLSVCGDCRETLELYRMLESGLVSRAKERPSSRAASRALTKRLRVGGHRTFVSSPWSAPAIIGTVVALSILITLVFGLLADGGAAQEVTGLTGWERFFTEIPDWIAGLFGGDIWLISAVYGAVALGFVLTGSLVTLRFVRGR